MAAGPAAIRKDGKAKVTVKVSISTRAAENPADAARAMQVRKADSRNADIRNTDSRNTDSRRADTRNADSHTGDRAAGRFRRKARPMTSQPSRSCVGRSVAKIPATATATRAKKRLGGPTDG